MEIRTDNESPEQELVKMALRGADADAAHRMVTVMKREQTELLLRVVADTTQYEIHPTTHPHLLNEIETETAAQLEDEERPLVDPLGGTVLAHAIDDAAPDDEDDDAQPASPQPSTEGIPIAKLLEVADFLDEEKFEADYEKCIGELKRIGLAEGVPSIDEAKQFLGGLFEDELVDLYVARETFKNPKMVIAAELDSEHIEKLSKGKRKDIICKDPKNPVLCSSNDRNHVTGTKFHIAIVEGAGDEELSQQTISESTEENGIRYDISNEMMNGQRLHLLSPSLYFALASILATEGLSIDTDGKKTLLDRGDRKQESTIIAGNTDKKGRVVLSLLDTSESSKLRIRSAAGGIFVRPTSEAQE